MKLLTLLIILASLACGMVATVPAPHVSTPAVSTQTAPPMFSTYHVCGTVNGLNVRKRPDANSSIVGLLANGEQVLTSTWSDWIAVGGGWVRSKYLCRVVKQRLTVGR